MRMTRVTKVGLLLLVISLIPWGGWTVWNSTRTWFLINNVPISLSKGSYYDTGLITANMDALYSIQIGAEYSYPIAANQQSEAAMKLACQIGVNDPTTEPCQAPPVWKFHWKLSDNGSVIQGDSDETIGQGWISRSGKINREIGVFRTKSGHRYKFDVEVLFNNHDAKIVNPHLMVGVADYHTESSLFLTGLLRLLCAPIAIIGLLVAGGSLLSQWFTRKRDLVLADDRKSCDKDEM